MTVSLVLGTAGHIDHGKTALVRVLTGIDTDRLEEERQRGISIDLGFAHLDLGDVRYGIIDVPGHERFIKNMVAGVSGIDVALLVIAADDGVMPQTREHLAILELLGLDHGLIVLSKVDLVDEAWIDMVEEDVRALVRGTFLENATIVRASAVTQEGLDTVRDTLRTLAGQVQRAADREHPFVMAIDRVFALPGRGTVVTGTVTRGAVAVGDILETPVRGGSVRVRGLHRHGVECDRIGRDQRAAINLHGVHHDDLDRGDVLATPGYLVASRRLTVSLDMLTEAPWPLRHRGRVRLHLGTKEVAGDVRLLAGTTLSPGAGGLAQIVTAEPVAAVGRQRFIIRAESPLVTLGGGVVLQPHAAPIARRDDATKTQLPALGDHDAARRLETVIALRGITNLADLGVARDADVAPEEVGLLTRTLIETGRVRSWPADDPTHVVHDTAIVNGRERLVRTLRRLHAATPLQGRIVIGRLRAALRDLAPAWVDALVASSIEAGVLVGDADAVSLSEFAPQLTDRQKALRDDVLTAYRDAGFRPPEPARIAETKGIAESQLRPIIELCVAGGDLVFVDRDVYLHRAREHELRTRVQEELAAGAGLTVSEIKELLGTSRKYGVPLCEYLDRVGVTTRRGDRRFLAPAENST